MSIEWMTSAEFEDWTRRASPPIGLWPRMFLDGRLADECDLAAALGRASEKGDWMPGVGVTDRWSGSCDGVPFGILGRLVDDDHRWGFNLMLPAQVRDRGGDFELDVEPLLEIARALPVNLMRNRQPYIDALPYAGAGWGVVAARSPILDFPLFKAPSRGSAEAVASFFNEAGLDRYEVVKLEATKREWIVAGPRVGPYLSHVVVAESAEGAAKLADRYGQALGVPFTIRPVG
jgi:hypothetical protein